MLALRGTFGVLSVAELDALLDVLIADGYLSVVMDLTGLTDVDYMATAGMEVIVDAERRLAALDRTLTVCSPSVKILQVLETVRYAGLNTQAGTSSFEVGDKLVRFA